MLFFVLLALIALASGLAVDRTLTTLEGTASQVNLTGSLRWMARDIEVAALRLASSHRQERPYLDDVIARFDATLTALVRGGANAPALPAALKFELEALAVAWRAYETHVRDLMTAAESGAAVGELANQMHQEATAVLLAADRITGKLTEHVGQTQDDIRTTLGRLALANGAFLIAGLLAIRLRIVRPLRRLAEASRRIADGEYDKRLLHRSDDEIGGLADAFDCMAEQVERQIAGILEENRKLQVAQQELRKLYAAVEHSPATVLVTDRNGIIEYVNPKFSEITGYTRAEVLGQTPRIVSSGRMSDALYADMWRTLNAGHEWRGHLLNKKKSGVLFWEDTWISPIRNDQGEITHFIAVKDDITERMRVEEERAHMSEILEQRVARRTMELADLNKELESFSYSVSHDLRAPLRAIHGFSHALEETCTACANPEARELLERIKRASVRMGDIIDDLLELSRISRTQLRFKRVDLSSLARSALDELQHADPGRRLTARIQEGVFVAGDKGLLRIALDNLLGNAWKFTGKRDTAEITFGATVKGNETAFFVRDNGAGFDMRFADKLFLPFQRLHHSDDFEGTGIGLATVRKIADMHGGRVWAEAAPGKGATFYFSVPNQPDGNKEFAHAGDQYGLGGQAAPNDDA